MMMMMISNEFNWANIVEDLLRILEQYIKMDAVCDNCEYVR